MHIHLDPLGGLAGDMFLAAVLDAFPAQQDGVLAAIAAVVPPDTLTLGLRAHADHTLSGARFLVEAGSDRSTRPAGPYRDIAARLRAAPLAPEVLDRALAIFALVAEAESEVHGIAVEEVSFHELAGWDSIADIVGAAQVIERLAARSWSVAPLPMGGGRIDSAHGPLPVPAPATAKLLRGFAMIDDGIGGERVTPTGAAILRHLAPAPGLPARPLAVGPCGFGFGTKRFAGISNVLRVLAFEPLDERGHARQEVGVIDFEIDDQTPEDLALGLDALRARAEVLDVVQTPTFGKKGRLMMSIRVLCRPEALDQVIDACFTETTTIGLRWRRTMRSVLTRRTHGDEVPVKVVERPGGRRSAKAESDRLRAVAGGVEARRKRSELAEADALEDAPEDRGHD